MEKISKLEAIGEKNIESLAALNVSTEIADLLTDRRDGRGTAVVEGWKDRAIALLKREKQWPGVESEE